MCLLIKTFQYCSVIGNNFMKHSTNLFQPHTIMRKLKGAVKETAKQKRERKQEFAKMRQQIHTVVLPTIAVIFLLICVYVYFKTRPSTSTMQYA